MTTARTDRDVPVNGSHIVPDRNHWDIQPEHLSDDAGEFRSALVRNRVTQQAQIKVAVAQKRHSFARRMCQCQEHAAALPSLFAAMDNVIPTVSTVSAAIDYLHVLHAASHAAAIRGGGTSY
jgi:hypothetical protein